MKLYTEEQVKKAIELARDTHQEGRAYMERDEYDYSMDEVVDLLIPIELPSDEEINDEWEVGHSDYQNGCNYGAKWMRDKIQGGNNEQ